MFFKIVLAAVFFSFIFIFDMALFFPTAIILLSLLNSIEKKLTHKYSDQEFRYKKPLM